MPALKPLLLQRDCCPPCSPALLAPLALQLTGEPLPHKLLMPCGAMRRCMAQVVEFVESLRRQVA